MRKRAALLFIAVPVILAAAAPVRHAGEWEVTLNSGKPQLWCFAKDQTFDQNNLARAMAKIPGSKCTTGKLETAGDVISFALQCNINGSTIVSSGTIEQTGPDAFTSKVHSKGGAVAMPDGKTFNMPAMDIVNVSRRLGPCKPGDRQSPF